MSISSNFAQYLTKKLNGLNANNITESGAIKFGSLTQMNNYLSIFANSENNIENIDYEEILNSFEEGTLDGIESEQDKSIATVLNEIMAIKDIQEAADINGDGEISADELESLVKEMAAADGDNTNLTLADIDKMIEQMDIDLNNIAEDSINEAVKELEEAEKAEEAKAAEQPQNTQATQGTSGGSSAGRSSGATGSKPSQPAQKAETAEEIRQQISDKNAEISEVEADAEAQIEEQEKQKQEAMKKAGVSEEEYEAYKEEENKIEGQIKDKETLISNKEDAIRDKDSTIESNENSIESLEAQISANESKRKSSDEEGASERNAEIDQKNGALQDQIDAKKEENRKLEEDKERLEGEKAQLETDKEQLETDKQNLLTQTLKSSEGAQQRGGYVQSLQIQKYDEEIAKIRADKQEKISGIKEEIKSLEVKLKDVEAKEELEKVLGDNKVKSGLGLTGEELVDVARQMLDKYGSSTGYCATGVSRTFAMAYGLNLHGNGCDWDTNMDNLVAQGAFEEITGDYPTEADLSNLPAGAVICWENTGGTNGGGAQYGHVTIADGKGGEISDHYSDHIYTHLNSYKVYYPVS